MQRFAVPGQVDPLFPIAKERLAERGRANHQHQDEGCHSRER